MIIKIDNLIIFTKIIKYNMEHRIYKILAFASLLIIIVFASLYDCFEVINLASDYRIAIKVSPMIILMILTFTYMCIYRVTIYSSILLMSLFLCSLGDIFIGLYDPSVAYIDRNKMVYFIVGGSCFLITRLLFALMFAIEPYKKFKIILYSTQRLILSHVIFMIPFTIFGILNITRQSSFVTIALFLYMFFGFGIQLSYAFLRIGKLPDESIWSSIFAFIGMGLFNLSDILLFISMYTDWVPKYVTFISNNIYWVAIYLISISVVRSPHEYIEKGKTYLPISFTTKTETF